MSDTTDRPLVPVNVSLTQKSGGESDILSFNARREFIIASSISGSTGELTVMSRDVSNHVKTTLELNMWSSSNEMYPINLIKTIYDSAKYDNVINTTFNEFI